MNNRLKGLDTKKIEKILKYWGFKLSGQEGSHRDWELYGSEGRLLAAVTTIVKRKNYPRGTLLSIIDQSGRNEDEWVAAVEKV